MSRDRAVRRAAREAQVAAEAAERAGRAARAARRGAMKARLTAPLRILDRPSRSGLLAARRRRTVGLMALGFVVVQVLAWAVSADWATRLAVGVASLFALPVVAAFLL